MREASPGRDGALWGQPPISGRVPSVCVAAPAQKLPLPEYPAAQTQVGVPAESCTQLGEEGQLSLGLSSPLPLTPISPPCAPSWDHSLGIGVTHLRALRVDDFCRQEKGANLSDQEHPLPPALGPLAPAPTHSGHSGGPASPRYRHSCHPLAAPPGTARGHSRTLGREQVGRSSQRLQLAHLCQALRPPSLTSSAIGPVAAQLTHLTRCPVEALPAAALAVTQEPVLALPVV